MLRPSGVSSARLASCAASASSLGSTPGAGMNSVAWRLPIVIVPVLSSSSTSTSPAASTARPLMASTFFCTMRSMPAMPIAESSPPIVVGIRQTSSETRTVTENATLTCVERGIDSSIRSVRKIGMREQSEGQHRDHDRQEDDRQGREQDGERDFVGRFLPFGPFDQLDHAVHERLAGVGGDADRDLVGEHLGAAGDGRAVAARFADHRRGLAGDGRFVDRGGALDDLAVGGNRLAHGDDEDVALAQRFCLPPDERAVRIAALWRGSWCGSCGAFRPGPCRVLPPWPRQSWRRSP